MVLKLPLGARDDVNEGRRPFERNRALGDMGGLRTPFVALCPFSCPGDTCGELISVDLTVSCPTRVGVCEVTEPCNEILALIEYCEDNVSVENSAC